MGRKRLIDADRLFFDSEIKEILGPAGVLLYIRLWSLAEDSGVYIPNYRDISLQMGAYLPEFPPAHVERFIGRLIEHRKVIPYLSEDGEEFHWIRAFLKYQSLRNPPPPSLPVPPWVRCQVKKWPSGKRYAVYSLNKAALKRALENLSTVSPRSQREKNHPEDRKENQDDPQSDTPGTLGDTPGSVKKPKPKPKLKDPESVLKDPQLLADSEKLMRAFSIDPKRDKFPFNWIGQKIKKGWTREIIVPIFSLCVSEAIRHHKRKPIKDLFPYFETIWTREAQNLKERMNIQEHEKRKEDEASFVNALEDITRGIGKNFKEDL